MGQAGGCRLWLWAVSPPLRGCPVLSRLEFTQESSAPSALQPRQPDSTPGSRADPDLAHSDPRNPLPQGTRTAERFRLPPWSQLRPCKAGSSHLHSKMTPTAAALLAPSPRSAPWLCPLRPLRQAVWFPEGGEMGGDAPTLGGMASGGRKEERDDSSHSLSPFPWSRKQVSWAAPEAGNAVPAADPRRPLGRANG